MGADEIRVIIVGVFAGLVMVGILIPDRRAGYVIPVYKTGAGIVGIGMGIGLAILGGYLVTISDTDPFRWSVLGLGGLLAIISCHGLRPLDPINGSVSD